jgi:hypothetical protein
LANDILGNPLVKFAIILGVLIVLAGIPFFTTFSTELTAAVTTGAGLIGLVVILWLFGPAGPVSKTD